MKTTTNISRAWPAMLLAAATLLFFLPLTVFMGNQEEWAITPGRLAGTLAAVTGVSFLVGLLLVMRLPDGPFQRLVALFAACGILLWIQGTVMVWNYGLLTGRAINWDAHRAKGYLELAVWAAVLGWALIRPRSFLRIARPLCLVLLVMQAAALAPAALRKRESPPAFKQLQVDPATQFAFARQHPNVLVLVLDTLQSDIFQLLLDRQPALTNSLSGFTYYRNAVAGFPTTYASIAYLLTGHLYDNQVPVQDFLVKAYLSDESLMRQCRQDGYHVSMFSFDPQTLHLDRSLQSDLVRGPPFRGDQFAEVVDAALFRAVPHGLKRAMYERHAWPVAALYRRVAASGRSRPVHPAIAARLPVTARATENRDVAFLDDLGRRARFDRQEPTFKFVHLRGAHPPFTMNEHLEYEEMPFSDASYARQSLGCLRVVEAVLALLEQEGIHDSTTVLIVGDHGLGRPIHMPAESAFAVRGSEIAGSALPTRWSAMLPLMLVKPAGAKGALTVSDAPVCLGDIPALVRQLLAGTDLNVAVRAIADTRPVRHSYHYTWSDETWLRAFLPPMTELAVSGHAWLLPSWRPTGRLLDAGAVRSVPGPEPYTWGQRIDFAKTAHQGQTALQCSGLSEPEGLFTWTDGPQAAFVIRTPPPPPGRRLELVMEIADVFLVPGRVTGQTLAIEVNGQMVARLRVTGPGTCRVSLPDAALAAEGPMAIRLLLPDAISPGEAGVSADLRRLALAIVSLRIE